ncbi:hypothetical protein [Exiguobacterium undae]
MMNYGDSKSVVNPLVTGKTKDSVSRSLENDNIIESLNESQVQEFVEGLSKNPDFYFKKNSITVTMTEKQHQKISIYINDVFDRLKTTSNFEFESDIIHITKHYKDRLIERSDKYDSISLEDIPEIKRYICQFNVVSNKFRWNHKKITYVLSHPDPSYSSEKIIIALKNDPNGEVLEIVIRAVTYINEQ